VFANIKGSEKGKSNPPRRGKKQRKLQGGGIDGWKPTHFSQRREKNTLGKGGKKGWGAKKAGEGGREPDGKSV